MKRKLSFISLVVILILAFMLVSCDGSGDKKLPDIPAEKEEVALIGVEASGSIIAKYQDVGYYTGLSYLINESSIYFYFSNAQIHFEDKDVVVNGQVKIIYENLPDLYPAKMDFDLAFQYGGTNHSLMIKGRQTSAATGKFSYCRVDGVEYNPSSLDD